MTELLGYDRANTKIMYLCKKRSRLSQFLDSAPEVIETVVRVLGRMERKQAEDYFRSATGNKQNNHPFRVYCLACPLLNACVFPKNPRAKPDSFEIAMCYGCSNYIAYGDSLLEKYRFFSKKDWPYTLCPAFRRPQDPPNVVCNHIKLTRFDLDQYLQKYGDDPMQPRFCTKQPRPPLSDLQVSTTFSPNNFCDI
jgi:hypothetical protein